MANTTGLTEKRRGAWLEQSVVSEDLAPPAQMARVFDYLKGLHATHLIHLGVRLGLFEDLEQRPSGLSSDELATRLELEPRYVQIWCDAACALGLLDYELGAYRLAPGVDEVLGRPGGASYVGEFPSAHLQVARDYAFYEDTFRTGRTHPYAAHDEPFLKAVAAATRVLPRMFIDAVLPQLPNLQAGLEAGARILDVGCGAGHALVELATRFEDAHCVGLDVDPVSVAMARELLEQRTDLAGRVEAVVSDAGRLPDTLVARFDLVTMFLVLHEIEPAAKRAVLRECHRALRPGGALLLFDERYPDSPTELRDPTQIYAVMAQWYEAGWGNVIDDRAAIHGLLDDAGFALDREVALSRFYIETALKAG